MRHRFQPGSTTPRTVWVNFVSSLAAAVLFLGLGTIAQAQQNSIAIELNKLEPQGSQCRAYFVVNNKSDRAYQELKIDLVLFQPDGVIGRRFAVDLAPLKANKRTVKLFELADTSCDKVDSFLINEVMDCKAESGTVDDCLKHITASSLTKVQLTK